jgi:hypothetical protein
LEEWGNKGSQWWGSGGGSGSSGKLLLSLTLVVVSCCHGDMTILYLNYGDGSCNMIFSHEVLCKNDVMGDG